MDDGNQLQPGELVGPYSIVRKIGQGGMGEVYEAWEEVLQRRIALKVLSSEASTKPDLVKRFQAEGRALARLKHGSIVHIHNLGEHKGHIYMAMEYVDGWPLDEFLKSHFCGFPEIFRMFRQMLEGLAAAHDAGVIHRDLKPQNVMVSQTFNAKLVDFGIAKLHEDHEGVNTVSGMLIGTLNYIAPEIFNGGVVSKQSDIYSLGLVMIYMLTGKIPFSGRVRLEIMEKILKSDLKFGPETGLVLPSGLKDMIRRMTAKSPQDRFLSARDVLLALAKINVSELPKDLCVSMGAQLKLGGATEMRAKCESVGLEFLEIGLVACLATQITVMTPNVANGKDLIVVNDPALIEAMRRYVVAKKQLVWRSVFQSTRFKMAAGSLAGALVLAVVLVGSNLGKDKGREPAAIANPIPLSAAAMKPLQSDPPLPPPKVAPAEPVLAMPEPTVSAVKVVATEPKGPPPASPRAPASAPTPLKSPIPVLPSEHAVIAASRAKTIQFEWRSRGNARSYEVSVRSLDSDFAKTLVSQRLSVKLAGIPTGHYTWSIRPIDAKGKRGPISNLRTFVIKPDHVLASPAPDLKAQKPVLLPAVIQRRYPAGR